MTTDNTISEAAAPTTAGAASWQLDAAHSSVSLSHKSIWNLVTVRGGFDKLTGSAEILADGSATGRIEIDAASINTRHGKRDEHLRSADFFNVAEHPQLTVDIISVTRQGDGGASVAGTLTVAGVSKPLNLTARITEDIDQAVTLAADAEFNRADYGLTWGKLGMIRGNASVSVVARFVRPA
jgi:polyisoprenoid-binding protein YceI